MSERFAAASDALLAGNAGAVTFNADLEPELALAVRLRDEARAGVPDPAFLQGLRRESVARVAAAAGHATTLRWATVETAIGTLALAYRNGRVVYCNRFESAPAFERDLARVFGEQAGRDTAAPAKIARGVQEHLAGRRRFAAIDLSWLPPFQQRVLEKTAEIPRGEVRPYAWVAREIGAPGATRAVGTALGHNPIPFIVPCHRVVRADGTLGEYSGGGPAHKERVLTLEGAPVAELLAGARRGERLRGSRTTHIVCYPSCHAARRIRPENAAPFASLTQAQSAGYRPCALCRPA
ncbi:MAG TPA: methylated-DNA--[protein]-cysteine S-methyltransferase [Dehalococcoidia bacterium]|nr:methylated-DNA--[protein]-cysteine S-methyltransferase [Dehalococcoidia bacterium]